jgi:SAM-dependent methyltransferase
MNLFDHDYYECGVSKGISLYENYRWLPERSFVEAHWFVKTLSVEREHTVIDYGCAKGFFVKAMRQLGYNCFGYDISEYAITNCDPEVKGFVFNTLDRTFDFGFCKDVLEHCIPETLPITLELLHTKAQKWLIIVPLAEGGKFIEPNCNKDITHRVFYTGNQWLSVFKSAGFKIWRSDTVLRGFKEHWKTPGGNLFVQVLS